METRHPIASSEKLPAGELPNDETYEEEYRASSRSEYCYYLRQSEYLLFGKILILELISLFVLVLAVPVVTSDFMAASPSMQQGVFITLLLIFAVAHGILLVYLLLTWLKTVYIIRPDTVILHRGIFKIVETEFLTQRIETVNVTQPFLGRIFNYGTIRIYNPVLKEDWYLEGIPEPYLYSSIISNRHHPELLRFTPRPPQVRT